MEYRNQHSDEDKISILVRKVWLAPIFYVYFLIVLIALGMLYVHRENMVNRNSISPDVAVDSVYDQPVGDIPPGPASTGVTVDVSTLFQPTKAQLEKGEQLFKVDCSPCHGVGGKGDGPAAASLNPKPRDFHSPTGWKNGRFLSQMFKTVSEGIPGTAMVSFAASISASDRLAIVDFIRSKFGDFPKDTPEQLEAMNKTHHLGKVQAPATRIPVSEAMNQIEEEIPRVRMTTAILTFISQHPTEEGSQIFNNVTIDKQWALTGLAMSAFWSKAESDFVMSVTANTIQNGFNPKVAQLTAGDWNTLYNYLRDLFLKENITEKNG